MGTYHREIQLEADHDAVLDRLVQVFASEGLQVTHRDDQSLFLDRGETMNSPREHPLRGISDIRFHLEDGRLVTDASFGRLKQLMKFMGLFLGGMAIVFYVLFQDWKAVLPLAPWPILLPIMWYVFEKRIVKELDVLMANLPHLAAVR